MSVTAAAGFAAAGVAAGIKPNGAPDLAVVTGSDSCTAAAVFTGNRAAAAPVVVSRAHFAAAGSARAVVLNSGCANAGTGASGREAAISTAEFAAKAIGCRVEEVLVCSTGAIGPVLPLREVLAGLAVALEQRAESAAAGTAAARAILTTDNVAKEALVAGPGYVIGGMAKGAGMLRPDMATMLAVLTTDAAVSSPDLQQALTEAVDVSFNSLNVDGCESTNDTVIVLSSGAAGVAPPAAAFRRDLTAVCRDLALQMAADAEGAGRVVTISVVGASDDATARRLGMAAADAALVRASFYGSDPNWGRILTAVGSSGIPFDVDVFGVSYQGVTVAEGGEQVPFDADALRADMATGPLAVHLVVGDGPGRAEIITTDLTPDYVTFNAEYS